MLPKKSKAVSENNGPVPHQDKLGSDQPTMADLYRMIKERFDQSHRYLHRTKSHFDQQDTMLDELTENLKRANQRVVGQQDARQPRPAMEADGPADKKTRERTEDAATAVQVMHGDSSSANQVDPGPESSTSFGGDSTGPPTLPCSREDGLVSNGAAASKSYLSPLEMRSSTATGGLLPAGKASTRRRSPFISRVFGSAQSEKRIMRGRQLNTSCTAAVSAGTSFLSPPSGGLRKQN